MKVAVSQLDVRLFEPEANVEKHLAVIAEARSKGVELLVFPELSLTGYLVGPRGYELGLTRADPLLRRLAEAAGDMGVVVGFVEEGFAAQFFNASALLQRGEVLFIHRKLNLANYGDMEEGKYFATGRYVETFPLKEPWRGALLLCSDMWNPALVHLAALHGATLLLAPTNSSLDLHSGDLSKPERWDVFLRFYSTVYGLPVAFANRIGREKDHQFWGGSRILDAQGQVLIQAEGDEEALLITELDYHEVRRARFELPTVRDSNLSLIHREIQRLVERVGVPDSIRKD